MKKEKSEFLNHFSHKVSNSLVEFVRETALRSSRYLFVWRKGKAQMAYCTHCQKEYQIGDGKQYVKHNERAKCLRCNSDCIVKSNGRGRSRLIDEAYVVWYDKSAEEPRTIVARWLHVLRDYRGDYRKTQTLFSMDALYTFEYNRGGQMYRRDCDGKWKAKKRVSSVSVGTYWYPADVYVSYENIKETVSGTPFQYSMWQEYESESYNYLRFFDPFARYPSVEYLTKLGLQRLVSAKLLENKTYGTVYWRGNSIDKVLRMSKAEVRDLRAVASKVEPKSLYSYHFWRKQGWNITPSEGHFLRDLVDKYHLEMLQSVCELHEVAWPDRYWGRD